MADAEPSRTSRGDKDALGGQRPVPRGSFRDRLRRRPVVGLAWRVSVFLAGLISILTGCALVVLPGPLTIPPILLGLWLWSTEFQWAHRFFHPFKEKGRQAWEHSKQHPVVDSTITAAGLAGAVVAFWAIGHFELLDRGRQLVGL